MFWPVKSGFDRCPLYGGGVVFVCFLFIVALIAFFVKLIFVIQDFLVLQPFQLGRESRPRDYTNLFHASLN